MNLLSRALALAGADDRLRSDLLPSLCRAFAEVGRIQDAAEIVDDVVQLAASLDEREGLQLILRTILDPPWSVAKRADPPALVERGLRVFGAAGDDEGLALTWRLASDQSWMSDRWAECAEAAERALAHSSRAGIAAIVGQGGAVIVRHNWHNVPLQQRDGRPFDLWAALRRLGPTAVGDTAHCPSIFALT